MRTSGYCGYGDAPAVTAEDNVCMRLIDSAIESAPIPRRLGCRHRIRRPICPLSAASGPEDRMGSWMQRITDMTAISREIASTPQAGIWRQRQPPAPGVDEGELQQVERAIGAALPSGLRCFYLAAGGWAPFTGDIDILAPSELLSGPRHDHAAELAVATEQGFAQSGVRASDVLVFGASATEHDLYTIVIRGPLRGTVLWHAGYEVERYPDFE